MGSKLLTQSLLSIPRPIFPNSSNNLAFSTIFPSRPCFFNSTPITISRALSTNSHSPIFSRQTKRPLVVRAEEGEAEPEPAAEETPENAEAGEESETVALAVAEEEAKPPRKPIVKLGDIMGILNKRAVEASEKERPVPDLRTGDIVEIKLEVPENRRRASTYKGIVISKQNAGIHTTIRIRRIIAGIGVEIVFPVYSPNIKEIKVVKHRKVRRSRLYYLRDKLPRFSTFK